MSVDNPYYFCNGKPKASAEQTNNGNRGFSFFGRRRSSSGSNKSLSSPKQKQFNTNGAVYNDGTAMGSKRGSLSSLFRSSTNSVSYSQGSLCGASSPVDIRMSYDERSTIIMGDRQSYTDSMSYNDNDEVFIQSPRSCTNTLSYAGSGTRRHSTGTFMNRDRSRCSSLTDQVPNAAAPKPPKTLHSIKTDKRYGDVTNSMDDILIITARQSESALTWANFLKTRFDKITKQRGRQAFNFLHIKIDEGPISSDIVKRCLSTKLQIVVICSTLIALPSQFLRSQLSFVIRPDVALSVLLNTTEEQMLQSHKYSFPLYDKWRKCAVNSQDQSSIGQVLGIATDILGRALCQRPLCGEGTIGTINKTSTEAFTVLPRKVKIGQNKVVVLLNEPLQRNDLIKIKIDKSGTTFEITTFKKRNPFTLQFSIPEICMEISTMIEIKIERNGRLIGSRPVKCESRLRELEQILKSLDCPLEFMCTSLGLITAKRDILDSHLLYAFKRNVPKNFNLFSLPPNKSKGFMQPSASSSEEYPTLLHFAARWGLEQLSMQLLDCPGSEIACELRNVSGKIPADIAETAGYVKLAESLKNFTQINEFSNMYHYFKGMSDSNNSITIKADIEIEPRKDQGACGISKPMQAIPNEYMEMNSGSSASSSNGHTNKTKSFESINAVSNLNYIDVENGRQSNETEKELRIIEDSERTNELKVHEPDYFQSNDVNTTVTPLVPDAFSQECSKQLENFKSSPFSDYVLQPSNKPVNTMHNPFSDYIMQPSNRPVEQNTTDTEKLESETPLAPLYFKKENNLSVKSNSNTLRRQGSDSSSKTASNVDDELLEIINDFKNNVFTIQEVEQLVATWKSRNDVQQNVKDKQQQLRLMREEYDKIQMQMKEKMKRPTPFERVRRLFSRTRSISRDGNEMKYERTQSHDYEEPKMTNGPSGPRPMSSLSVHSVASSSSSGRLSTGSAGSSLGDSGTHSDNEDRRFPSSTHSVYSGGSMDNYLIPPTPRPVSSLKSVDEPDRPICGSNRQLGLNLTEHYIMFPSNIPVNSTPTSPVHEHHGLYTNGVHHDYMNLGCLNTIDENKETDVTDGNLFSVQTIKIQKNDSIRSPTVEVPNLCSSFKGASQRQQCSRDIINNNCSTTKDMNENKCKSSITQEKLDELVRKVEECNAAIIAAANDQQHDYMNV